MKKPLLFPLLLVLSAGLAYCEPLYTQEGTDPPFEAVLRSGKLPVGTNSKKGVTGSKIRVNRKVVAATPEAKRPIPQEIRIHTLGNSVIPRSDFGQWSRWYQEDGSTQVFRLFKGETNVRNERKLAARIEAFSEMKWTRGPWHEWSGTYTIIKPHGAAIFQAKNGGEPNWAVQLTMNGEGDVFFSPRRKPSVKIAEKMTGKPFHIRVRDNGHDFEVYLDGRKVGTGSWNRPEGETGFRWGMYLGGNPVKHDAMICVSGVMMTSGTEDFTRLFDGKTLNGWEGDLAYWSVEDGAITGKTDGTLQMNRFLTWKNATVRNFDLKVKVRVSPGGNSGIQYRGTRLPEIGPDIVAGYQCDIVADLPKYHGMLYEERGRRILSHTGEKVIIAPDGKPWITGTMEVKKFPADEWQDFRILVRGNHHQHWVNGHLTADLIDLDEKGRALEGVLAVQVHVGPAMKIQFKDFMIRHLPDDLPLQLAADHPIPPGAPGVRPQAKLPADWKPPLYGQP